MTVPRVFVSYETTDAAFAIQLMTDLREAGAEVITDSVGLEDAAFEQFLSEQLPQCHYLIVVQTPAALHSPRVRFVVDNALKLIQTGQMTAILRVIAPDPNGAQAQAVPLKWANTPEFDASQDYARALARLHLQLGLSDTQAIPAGPPPASFLPVLGSYEQKGIGNTITFGSYDPRGGGNPIPYTQRPIEKDRPTRPMRHMPALLTWRIIIPLLVVVLLLASVLAFALIYHRTPTQTIKPAPLPPHSGVYYYMQNRNSGKFLDNAGSTVKGTGMIQWGERDGNPHQEWTFIPVSDGYYYIQNRHSGKVLDAAIAVTPAKKPAPAKKPGKKPTPAKKPTTPTSSVPNKATASMTAGVQIIQWDKGNGQTNQEWKLSPAGHGYYYIQNRNSNLVLDVAAASTGDSAMIIQWVQKSGNGSLNQQWILKKV